ncbi:MAG: phosphoribosylanthranilate isomerase [Desulfotignum sp.]
MAKSFTRKFPALRPFIKICGLTDPDNAAACAQAGADVIGLVFYHKSPRHLPISRAVAVVQALPSHVPVWGVFVDATLDTIMAHVNACGLTGVQLHGNEPPELLDALAPKKLTVVKAVFASRHPHLDTVSQYASADGFLVECGLGKLPGGNARTWDFSLARNIAAQHPVILAGGLYSGNISQAIADVFPMGVDISSGVETAPGTKHIPGVADLVRQVNIVRQVNRDRQVKGLQDAVY